MIKKFLNLGLQPLANSYLSKNQLNKIEKKYSLEVGFNIETFLVSIINTVPKEKMFNNNYPYKSSESATMRISFKNLAKKLKKRFNPKKILEIGCNDGAFLKNFNKSKSLGIEPCKNLANLSRKKGINVISKYWDISLAKKISNKFYPDIIYSANTLSHIENFNEIFDAINIILPQNGILIIEDPSLLDSMKSLAYDQFYCEHIYVYSAIAMREILKKFNLEIFDIEKTKTHGGSNRYYIKKITNETYKIKDNVSKEIKKELKFGLNNFSTYLKFANKVKKSKEKLLKIFKKIKNKKIIGYGATAKSCTVLNYCNIGLKEIDFFYDTTSYKIGKYLPGSKIEIKKYKKLKRNTVDYAFLGAWNFKDEIFGKERDFIKKGGKFITHVPFPHIVKNF
jgi:SAM-dependent methyltransferase